MVVVAVIVLVHEAVLGCLRWRTLTALNSCNDSLLKVDHAASALERVPSKAVGLVRGLVRWRCTRKLPFRAICVLGVDVLVASAVDGGEALGSHEGATSFVVVHADARECLWMHSL